MKQARTPARTNPPMSHGVRAFLVLLLLLTSFSLSHSQDTIRDCSADTESLDAILGALYGSISGPAGQDRDWDRLRCLCHPKAQFIPIFPQREKPELSQAVYFDLETFIEKSRPHALKEGFVETEIHRVVQSYGGMTQVWSTYEAKHAPDDAEPFVRGINSIQLLHDGSRWWLVNIYWQPESDKFPLPEQYLPKD